MIVGVECPSPNLTAILVPVANPKLSRSVFREPAHSRPRISSGARKADPTDKRSAGTGELVRQVNLCRESSSFTVFVDTLLIIALRV